MAQYVRRTGETAAARGRILHAALHFRCAEFFMLASDPRKEPLRKRLITLFCEAAGVSPSARHEVAFGGLHLPAWSFPVQQAHGTLVVFGGFDSYIEEFFPILMSFQEKGWNVVAFEGPGQGAVLEEQRAPLIRDWHRPVTAVLDAFNFEDVTLVGISLGGCLAIRAAAFEPRVRRVVAFDVLSDFLSA
jgi:pimeloyl-ACP methyl ester carboxylesterase